MRRTNVGQLPWWTFNMTASRRAGPSRSLRVLASTTFDHHRRSAHARPMTRAIQGNRCAKPILNAAAHRDGVRPVTCSTPRSTNLRRVYGSQTVERDACQPRCGTAHLGAQMGAQMRANRARVAWVSRFRNELVYRATQRLRHSASSCGFACRPKRELISTKRE